MPVGAAGCNSDFAAELEWFAGVSYGTFQTELDFAGDASLEESTITTYLGKIVDSYTFSAALGLIAGGTLSYRGSNFRVGQGWLVLGSVARTWNYREIPQLFISGSLSAGLSQTSTRSLNLEKRSLTAIDLRLGILAGTTVWEKVTLYGLARVFGGPVFWTGSEESLVGGDKHHYQLGCGSRLQVGDQFSFLIEASLFGERSFSSGILVNF